ncbi:MAG TPA: hypothetical protein VGM96_20715 [Reyranella sp.]
MTLALVVLLLVLLINLGVIGGVIVRDMRRRKAGPMDFVSLTAVALTACLDLAAIVLLLA